MEEGEREGVLPGIILCRMAKEMERQKETRETEKGQTRDPRIPKEVLIQEGIESHPGPNERKKDNTSRTKARNGKQEGQSEDT